MTCQRPARRKMVFSSEVLVDDLLRLRWRTDVVGDCSGGGRCSNKCDSCCCWSGNRNGPRMYWLVLALVALALPSGCASTESEACSRALQRDDYWRDVNIRQNPEQTKCDQGNFDPSRWYTFRINGDPATIPTQCIKNNMCGAKIAMRVELPDETPLQTPGQNVTATLCGSYDVLGQYDCCVLRSEVVIVRCEDGSLVYNFPKEFDRCPVAVCLQDSNTEVPSSVVAVMGQPYTLVTWTEPETTTAADLENTITTTLDPSETSLPEVSPPSEESTQGSTETSSEVRTDVQDEQISTTVESQGSDSTTPSATPVQDVEVSSAQSSATTNEDRSSSPSTNVIVVVTSDSSDLDTTTVGSFLSSEVTVSEQSPLDSRDDSSSSTSTTLRTTDTGTITIDTSNTVTTLIDTAPPETTFTLRTGSEIRDPNNFISSSSISHGELVHSTETTENTMETEQATKVLGQTSTESSENISETTSSGNDTSEKTSSGKLSPETASLATSPIPSQQVTTSGVNLLVTIKTCDNLNETNCTLSTISNTNQTLDSNSSLPHQRTSVSSKIDKESTSPSASSRLLVQNETTGEVTKQNLTFIPETSSSPLVSKHVPIQTDKTRPPVYDVVVNETVRLVFRGNISEPTMESRVLSLLAKFLESVKDKRKQANGLEWSFSLVNISKVQNFLDQKSYIDFRAITMGESSDGILKVFRDYELREYLFKNDSKLNLIAECRVSAECHKDSNQPVASASSSLFAKNTPAFVTVIVLCSVCLLVLVVAIFYSRLSKRGSWKNSEAQPGASREHRHHPGWNASPYTDQEIMKDEMVDDASCAGSAKDGDTNLAGTWVIPLDDDTGSAPRLLTVNTEDTKF